MYICLTNRTQIRADHKHIPEVFKFAYGRQQFMNVQLYAADGHKVNFTFHTEGEAQAFFKVIQEAVLNKMDFLDLGDVHMKYNCEAMPQLETRDL